ncbi:N-acetylmuramic acid 6-phosphate etherase [Streptomyces sp. NRRL F-4489]|nr:N-acetylmuramic acid 6-phosphate etherase [Streptomyces sp. NRRL F-4489]
MESLTTEAFRPELADIDRRPTLDIARLMNDEDATVPAAIAERLPQIAAAIDATAARMARGGRLIYAGAGTAGRLGVLDASECPPTFNTDPSEVLGLIAGGPSAMVTAVEGAEDSKELAAADLTAVAIADRDVVVGISASGRTPYAIGAVEHARAVGALTIGLSCNADSALASAAEHGIEIVVGPELLTGSTRLKAGTAQKLVLNMISTITMIRLGKTYGNLMVDVRASNDKLRARSRRIVALATGASDLEIETALNETGGEVKNAILVLLGGVGAHEAARLLHTSKGNLRTALQSAAPTPHRAPTP